LAHAGLAQPPVEINDWVEERNFMPNELTWFADTTRRVTLEQIIRQPPATLFRRHPAYQNTDFRKNAAYWIRFPMRHTSASGKVWLLEFYDQTIDYIDAYVPMPDGSYSKVEMGDQYPFSRRLFRHKNFELLLNMPRDTVVTYYFRVTSHEFADLRIALRSVNWFVYYALNEYFLFGTFYGMILIISLYNLLVYLAIREVKYIYYICYLLSVAGYALGLDGIGFQYVWPQHPAWNDYATGLFLLSLIIWSLLFTRKFLNTAENAPVLHRLLGGMAIARVLWFLVCLLFFPGLLTYRNLDVVPFLLIFFTAIYVWRHGYKPARFFVIAYGMLFAGFLLRTLVYFNLLPFTIGSHYSLHFSFVLEMLFLTFALGDRIRILKDEQDRSLRSLIGQKEENLRLQSKVNRELEAKVRERTRELDQKNQELAVQAEEIRRINSLLDRDNWQLKNNIREIKQESVFAREMPYAEFRQIFADDAACYRYLDKLKWQPGYACRKCSHDHYFESTRLFSRRCTRCGYDESVTAHTVFQGLKFPVVKAFYLVYLELHFPKRHTLDELSVALELRRNTVWSFRKRIQNLISQNGESDLIVNRNNWPMPNRPFSTFQAR
jgi:hypothetical protein